MEDQVRSGQVRLVPVEPGGSGGQERLDRRSKVPKFPCQARCVCSENDHGAKTEGLLQPIAEIKASLLYGGKGEATGTLRSTERSVENDSRIDIVPSLISMGDVRFKEQQ